MAGIRIDAEVRETDTSGTVLRDLTRYLVLDGSQIERDSCAETGHLTARLRFIFDDGVAIPKWSAVRLALSINIINLDDLTETGFEPFGVLIPESPERVADEDPQIWDVDCHDAMTVIAGTAGRTYSTGGGSIGQNISKILAMANEIQVDPALTAIGGAAEVRQFPIKNSTSFLLGIDHLLESAGWRPAWTDRNGQLTSAAFVDPSTLPAVAHLSGDVIGLGARAKDDTWGTPNQAVFIRDVVGSTPVEGDGIYTINNIDSGPASQNARDGRVVSSSYEVDADSHSALVAYANREAMKVFQVPLTVCMDTIPRTDLWHRDVVTIDSSDLDYDDTDKFIIDSWVLPLDGGLMNVVLAGVGPVAIPPPPDPSSIPPGLVRNLVAYYSPTPTGRIIVDWDAPASGASPFTYRVERDGIVVATNQATTSWADINPVAGSSHVYTVRAINANGVGIGSSVVLTVRPSGTRPTAVRNLAGTRTPLGPPNTIGIVLTWDAPAVGDTPITYDIFRNNIRVVEDRTTTTWTDRAFPAGSNTYSVRPSNASGSGPTESVTVGP